MKPVYPKKKCVVCGKIFETNRKRRGSRGLAFGVKRPVNAVTCSRKCSSENNLFRQR